MDDEIIEEIPTGDYEQDIIVEGPLMESDVDPSKAVYSVEYIKKELCSKETETMTVLEFDTCVNYASYEVGFGYLSMFLGLVIGFILVKAVSDGWT